MTAATAERTCPHCTRPAHTKGLCKPCYERVRKGLGAKPAPRFDPAPILAIAEQQCISAGEHPSIEALARRAGLSDNQIRRYRNGDRMFFHTADRVAINLGLHPGMVWPEWWTT